MKFTVKELCEFLEAEVPDGLISKQDAEVKAINARYTTLEKGDVFYDINNDCEDLSILDPNTCAFIVSERDLSGVDLGVPCVRVNNALERYVSLCKCFVDEQPNVVRIAVTGSTGKTSLKETIAAILANVASTDKSFSNQNNIYYISKKYQSSFVNPLRFYVQETSMKAYEDINLTLKLAEAYQPNVVVMTNIHDNHAEEYGTRENIFKLKSSLVEYMGENGVAFLNKDDELLRSYHPRCKTIYYSLEDTSADLYASNISISNDGTVFDIHWQGRVIKNIHCNLIGKPNVYNCMVAFAIGSLNGVDDELLVRSIEKFRISYALRQNHIKIGPYNLFVDCFNASLESIENDMRTMEQLAPDVGGRKVVIVGDVAELGDKAEEIHRQIGAAVTSYKMDRYFCFGKYSSCMIEGAREQNPNACISAYENNEELEESVRSYIRPGDLILWKASRDTHIELSIDNLFGTDYYPLYPKNFDEEAKIYYYSNTTENKRVFTDKFYRLGEPAGGALGKKVYGGSFEYCSYYNGVKLVRYYSRARYVVLPAEINGIKMRSIGDRAFYKNRLRTIDIPYGVSNIGTNAFLRCYNLRIVKLPESLKFIDFSAFGICTALEEICIPRSCLIVRRKAFYQCKRLKTVVVEGTDTLFENGALLECPNVRIKCHKNSLAEKYAIENGIKYSIIEENSKEETWITVPIKEKEIVIDKIFWEENGKRCRLNILIKVGEGDVDLLWYEIDSEWKQYVSDDRVDAIIVSLFLFAIRGGYAKFRSKYPISEQLKYQLEYHLIPQIVRSEENDKSIAVKIDCPTTNEAYEKTIVANATGFSRGIDSFATLYEYGKNSSAPEDYKVNFLNIYNVGAFHGRDKGKRSTSLSRELFQLQAEGTINFAYQNGYTPFVVDSNLDMFIKTHFNGEVYGLLRKFQNTATERNIGTTLLFQKLFTRFYYASGHVLEEFKLSLDESSALWEQYAVQFFSTENTRFYISNRDWTRMEKAQRIAQLPEAYDNLQVCLLESGNCGTCMKCKRTLMNLDVLGEEVLNKFKGSFDLEKYKKEHRKEFFESLWADKDKDNYAKDIFDIAVRNRHELIFDQQIEGDGVTYTYSYKKPVIIVRSLPYDEAEEIAFLINDQTDVELEVLGKARKTWYLVRMPDERKGYVKQNAISVKEHKAADSFVLNAGTELTLTLGKKYGFLPVFYPSGANEQVEYSVDNPDVAYINKSGWLYTASKGNTTVTAISKSGLTAKCLVKVCPPKETHREKGFKGVIKRILPTKVKAWIKKNILN